MNKSSIRCSAVPLKIRKNLLEYDQVMNEQRELIYAQRRRVLEGENMKDQILSMVDEKITDCVNTCCNDEVDVEDWDLNEFNQLMLAIIPFEPITPEYMKDVKNAKVFREKLIEKAHAMYEAKEAEFPDSESFRELERVILLRVIDRKWMDEIDDMEQLQQGIGMQAFAQRNPVDEYKMASYDMLDAMNDAIRTETIQMLYRIRIEKKVEREEVAKVTGTNKDETATRTPKKRAAQKIYPNSPCPCGSGLKYKQCCGRKA